MNHKVTPEKRDIEVLSGLEIWGILGIGQLDGLVFKKDVPPHERVSLFFNQYPKRTHYSYPYKRLCRLESAGLIKANSYVQFPRLFTLTHKGHSLLKVRDRNRLPGFRASISEAFVRHEMSVNAVGLVLSEVLGLEVTTERERFVWSGRGGWTPAPVRLAISDLWIVDQLQPKAIEVELVQKSESRYQEIWNAYRRRRPENGLVLYLTGWPHGPECILEHAERFRMDFIRVCALAQFRETGGRAPFIGYREGQVTVLSSRAAIPDAGPASPRVPEARLSARQDVSAGESLASVPFAPPSRRVGAGTLILPASRKDQFVPPRESRACPRPHPLVSPSPSPEGEVGGNSQ